MVWIGVFAILITLYSITLWLFLEERGDLSSELEDKNVVCSLLKIDDDNECDDFYNGVENSDIFSVLLNDKDSPDRKSAPTFCENVDYGYHDFRTYLLHSADFS